jgi:signal transduction histidine kinase
VRELLDAEPARAKASLEEARREVHDALDGVRAIAQAIYPSLLVDLGLAEALRGAARTARVRTNVEATTDRFAPEVEAAVFFSCVEAIEAVGRPPARAHIRVWPEPGLLRFEVALDGNGPDAPDLSGIEDRVGAVAGSVGVSSSDGPFKLLGSIPLAR